jgi:hypothetical protein
MAIKYTIEEVREYLARLQPTSTLLSEDYCGVNSKLRLRCGECGTEFERAFSIILRYKDRCTCTKCSNLAARFKFSYEYVVSFLSSLNPESKLLTKYSEYENGKSRLHIQCSCGNIFETNLYNIRQGSSKFTSLKCKSCCSREVQLNYWKSDKIKDRKDSSIKVMIEDINNYFMSVNSLTRCVGRVGQTIYLICGCGEEFICVFSSLPELRDRKCRNCILSNSAEVRGSKYLEICKDLIPSNYEILEYSTSSRGFFSLKCQCGCIFETTLTTLQLGGGKCPNCFPRLISQKEIEVRGFVESMYTVESNSRKIIPPKEIDIYIPELKVGIEFNGDYWHLQHSLEYHPMKYNMAKEKGIELLFLWEHTYSAEDWQELIKRALKGDVDYKLTLDYTQNYIKENQ